MRKIAIRNKTVYCAKIWWIGFYAWNDLFKLLCPSDSFYITVSLLRAISLLRELFFWIRFDSIDIRKWVIKKIILFRINGIRREVEELKEKTWELDTNTRNNLGIYFKEQKEYLWKTHTEIKIIFGANYLKREQVIIKEHYQKERA